MIPITREHEFMKSGSYCVLTAAGGVPAIDALDAASSLLDSIVAGLRELAQENACTHQATLLYYAAEGALALVIAAHAGVEDASLIGVTTQNAGTAKGVATGEGGQ